MDLEYARLQVDQNTKTTELLANRMDTLDKEEGQDQREIIKSETALAVAKENKVPGENSNGRDNE